MKTRPSRNSCDGFRRRADMNAQTPTGSRAADTFLSLPTSDVEGTSVCIATNGATWDNTVVSSETVTRDGSRHDRESRSSINEYQRPRSLSMAERDITEQLIDVLKNCVEKMQRFESEAQREELAYAFKTAAILPPITKQSLSELDIQNIISNIKLRHDVNFDRDLSFRPNNEGPKGQQKGQLSRRYWLALEAELHLYTRLFQGTPPLRLSGQEDASIYLQHTQKRVPKMFETIHEVLRSLVPEKDHARVDEHLDVRMLMQEIEKGVCDMVALVEWTARLLKEHCAPMRDEWVDQMVKLMRQGAADNQLETIVLSLTQLLAMLETMKLDVANHQIRNLKPLLIEDTVTYEKHYHLDRIVNKRSRVNFESAQKWWSAVILDLQLQYTSATRDVARTSLDMFSQAVVSSLFSRNIQQELPDTFYLDSDRIRALKMEIEDLVHSEMCFSMFNQLWKDLGCNGALSDADRHHLRSSLSAIMGESMGHGSQAWLLNSESLSLEIYRQVQAIAGRSPVFNHHILQRTNECLRSLFHEGFEFRASTLEAVLLPQVLGCINKHFNSSPMELYNSFVASPPPTSTHSFFPTPPTIDTFSFSNNTPLDRLNDLTKRISHIVILHWRIWAPIAYVQDDITTTIHTAPPPQQPSHTQPVATSPVQLPTAPSPPPAPICPAPASEHDVQVVTVMKAGDPPEPGSGYESNVSEEMRLP